MGNRRILSRHTESIPTHGMKHIPPEHTLITGHNIANRIVADMTHMDFSRRIREHLQKVVFLSAAAGGKGLILKPLSLPFFFDYMRVIFSIHIFFPATRSNYLPARFSIFSCSSLQAIHKGATGRALSLSTLISSPHSAQVP